MTIKNTCLVITTAFLFYVFVGPLDLGDGCLIISFCVYSIATMIYMVVLGNFPLDAVEAPEKRERIAHYFFEICEKRAIMIFTSMVVVAAVAFTKNIHFPMVVIVNNHEIPEFDLVGVVRFIFVILLFFSPALLCVDIYEQVKLNRKAISEFGQKKHEEPE